MKAELGSESTDQPFQGLKLAVPELSTELADLKGSTLSGSVDVPMRVSSRGLRRWLRDSMGSVIVAHHEVLQPVVALVVSGGFLTLLVAYWRSRR
jgi:hypothetical protein